MSARASIKPYRDSFIHDGALFLFVLLNILDSATTAVGLWMGCQEAAPLKVFAGNIGLLISVKMLVVFLVVRWAEGHSSGLYYWADFIIFGVVFWNIWQLLILSSFL